MSVFFNAKGTTNPSFKVGKGGVTIYQGTSNPNTAGQTGISGDIYFEIGTTPATYQYSSGSWQPISSYTLPAATTSTLGGVIVGTGLTVDGSGHLSANVDSVAGRTGNVVLSTADISGLGTIATQNSNAVDITGGTIDNTVIGATTPSTGAFTTIELSDGTASSPAVYFSGDSTTGLYSAVPGTISIATSGTNKLTIDTNGVITQQSDQFSSGVAASIDYLLRATTTDGTATTMYYGTTNQITLGAYSTVMFEIFVSARRTDSNSESASFTVQGCIDQQGTASTTRIVGGVNTDVIARDDSAWIVTATADDIHGALQIQVQGQAGKTVRWLAQVKTIVVTD